ncbi:hypothetical protein KFE25_011530 [Diacronema lutheri]|uniref:CDP-diacylglycerol--glycerol-3-phosphate 3-phosphatidyltransferase n=1 Tax=Diacronema lutheri TaxID=2081491 RepID=A0A8J6C9Y9_DIALT|nr:hypothetical protein KFE25_011530 [Diacronema lutheri]
MAGVAHACAAARQGLLLARVVRQRGASLRCLALRAPIASQLPSPEGLAPPVPSVSAATLPNLITCGRIAFSPLLGWLVLHEHYSAALVGCAAAAVSDMADGFIARRWSMETVLGSYLDPLADKVFIGSMCVSLAAVGCLEPQLAALVVARDLVLIAGTGVALWEHARRAGAASLTDCARVLARQPLRVHPTAVSKVTTAVQVALVGAVLADTVSGWPGESTRQALSLAVVLCTCASTASYAPVMLALLKRRRGAGQVAAAAGVAGRPSPEPAQGRCARREHGLR